MTTPEDQTAPSSPDVDQPEGGDGAGSAGRTPDAPDVDQPDGGERPEK